MGPEVWVGLAAVFVSGGAIGAAGTLMAQWIVRKVRADDPPRPSLEEREVGLLREEVADMARRIQNLDARLDFQEQLLGGATPTSGPPPRLAEPGDKGPRDDEGATNP